MLYNEEQGVKNKTDLSLNPGFSLTSWVTLGRSYGQSTALPHLKTVDLKSF